MLASRIRIFHPDPASKHSANLYDIYLLLCVQYWTPDDEQGNCPKLEKLVHLVGFIIRMCTCVYCALCCSYMVTDEQEVIG